MHPDRHGLFPIFYSPIAHLNHKRRYVFKATGIHYIGLVLSQAEFRMQFGAGIVIGLLSPWLQISGNDKRC